LLRGAKLAYVFDFGDEWRVLLCLKTIRVDDGRQPPRSRDFAPATAHTHTREGQLEAYDVIDFFKVEADPAGLRVVPLAGLHD